MFADSKETIDVFPYLVSPLFGGAPIQDRTTNRNYNVVTTLADKWCS